MVNLLLYLKMIGDPNKFSTEIFSTCGFWCVHTSTIWQDNWKSVDPARLGWELGAFEKLSVKNRSFIIMSTVVLSLLLLLLLLMLLKDILNLSSSYCKLDMLWQLHTLHMLKFNHLLPCQFITMLIAWTVETCKF